MDSSVAQMSCVLKVSINCEACRKKIYEVLQNIYGVYKINIDAEGGTVKVSGKVNPSTLLMVLEGSGKHAEVRSVTFDGEVKNHWGGGYDYFGEAGYGYGYNPYGVAPPPSYPYQLYGGYDYHWNDHGCLKMMPLPELPPPPPPPPPPLPLPSSSSSVPKQSQPPLPLQLQSQSQSVPPQPPKTPAPPNQAPPPPPPVAKPAQKVAKPASKSDKKSKCCIM